MPSPLLRPRYRIVVGDRVIDTADEPRASTLVDLVVRLDLDTPADTVTLVQGQVGGLPAAPGDEASVDLGFRDDPAGAVRVLTGVVVGVAPGLETERVVIHAASDALLRTYVDRTFIDVTAGDVVGALAAEAGLDVERITDGPALPAYVVDGRRNAARHIHDLAYLAGHDVFVTPEGALVFEPLAGNRTIHVLDHGEHILASRLRRHRPAAGTVQTWGTGPGAGHGDDAWAWLTKDFEPLRGSVGSDAPTLVVERPALRTAAAAASAATAISDRVTADSVRGWVRIQGRPQIRLADLVRLQRFPDQTADLEGTYQVRGIRHRVGKLRGFITELDIRSLAGSAAAAAAAVSGGDAP